MNTLTSFCGKTHFVDSCSWMPKMYKCWNICAKSKIFEKSQRLEIWVKVAGNGRRGGVSGVLAFKGRQMGSPLQKTLIQMWAKPLGKLFTEI